mmetsp:Transcript_16510/g.20111  ORF Transcript_16510/g.20111 Transcript_16510/m.20111 type:complete len:289 (+) Transcript_16510:161-1027(+)
MVAIENNASDCCSTLLGTRGARQLCTRPDRNARTALHYAYLTDAKAKIGRGIDLDPGIIPMIEAYSNQDIQDRKEMYSNSMKLALKRNRRHSSVNENDRDSIGHRLGNFLGIGGSSKKRRRRAGSGDENDDDDDDEYDENDDELECVYHSKVDDAASSPHENSGRSPKSFRHGTNSAQNRSRSDGEDGSPKPLFHRRPSSLHSIGSSAAVHHPHHHHHHLRHKYRHQKSHEEEQDPPLPPDEYIPNSDKDDENNCSGLSAFSSLATLFGCGSNSEPKKKYSEFDEYTF